MVCSACCSTGGSGSEPARRLGMGLPMVRRERPEAAPIDADAAAAGRESDGAPGGGAAAPGGAGRRRRRVAALTLGAALVILAIYVGLVGRSALGHATAARDDLR